MGEFAEHMSRLRISVSSHDAQVKAIVTKARRVNIAIGIRPGCYKRYSDGELAVQLSSLYTTAWNGYREGVARIRQAVSGEPPAEVPHWDTRRRLFRELRDGIQVEGHACGERIRVRTVGLREWRVDIAEGTIDRLDERAFLTQLRRAHDASVFKFDIGLFDLKGEYFSAGVKRSVRGMSTW